MSTKCFGLRWLASAFESGGKPPQSKAALAAAVLLFASIDSFESVSEWRALPADGVELRISSDAGKIGKAMRLDFDFRGHGGYAIARLDRPIDLPENFEFTFWIRGEAPPNTLEFKLIDESGQNVWWTTKRDFEFPRDWKRMSFKKRHFSFAWGPLGGGPLPKRIAALEIVVTAGRGGKGTVWIDELALDTLDTSADIPPPFTPAAGKTIALKLPNRLEFGGMTIDWPAGNFPRHYTVRTSGDGKEWETVREVRHGNGGRDFIAIPDGDARFVRLEMDKPYAVRQIALKPVEWSKTMNDFFASVARDEPRGHWPRYLLGEQLYWTVVGTDGSEVEALVSEDGMVEVGNAHFSIEPFLWMNGKLMTWSDAQAVQSLEGNHRPIPSVEWFGRLRVTADVDENDVLNVRYRIPPGARLYLAIRPLQVNPPWQFLKRIGGVVKISRIAYADGKVNVDAEQPATITPVTRPVAFGATTFDGGNIVDFLRRGTLPDAQEVSDYYGYASAAVEFRERDVTIRVPLGGKGTRGWHRKLNRVRIDTSEPRIFDSIRSNLAYILINRDGPSIQPGSRSYERSWIRDGSLTSTALLRLGHPEVVREFIEWYAQFQYEDGKIPCCVSPAGADPVPEHDSHGQFLYLIAEYYRHTRDRAFVEQLWPKIAKTVEYIDKLRHERMTPKYEGTVFYGLVPESISHEGYSAKPVHSYWDDFFVLRGLKDATFLANELEKPQTSQFATIRTEFERFLLRSIGKAIAQHEIDFIPGSADLGDFDATSTTIAISPVDEQEKLPQAALYRTFAKYMEYALQPRDYTPYEWRVVGALIRLGQKDQALQLMRRFFRDQRPPGWNHWAEVVFKDPRHPGFIGDMPHTWVGSDFIRSALDLFVFEHGDKLIIGAGIDPAWLEKGVSIENVSTHFGRVSYSMKRVGDEIAVEMPVMPKPPGGIVIRHPVTGRDVALVSQSMRLK